MADPFLDDLPRKKPMTHEIGQDLSSLSVDELDERIALLESEIMRLNGERTKKTKAKNAAADLFKLG
jgi:uncharacterized small protein (DUF1192 family)